MPAGSGEVTMSVSLFTETCHKKIDLKVFVVVISKEFF